MNVGSGRDAIRRMGRRPRLRAWLAAATLLGVGLGQVPLFGVLGYELALAAAVFGWLAGLDLGAALAREVQWTEAPAIARATAPGRALARTTCLAALLAASVTAIPGAIAALRGLWVPTCDWGFGLEAYALLPLTTAALAGALGHVVGIVAGARPVHDGSARARLRPHRSTLLALLVPTALLGGAALHRFYAAPPVFTYNAILGFFPGNLYDENIELGAPLVWSRLEQAAWLVTLVALVAMRLDVPRFRVGRAPRPAGRRWRPLALAGVAAAAAIALRLSAGTLGYRVDAGAIADALGGRLETEHFVIHYARDPEIERDLSLIAADHELRYAQVVAQIGEAPGGKITSYYFASREQKARWIGARDVEMAKPWRREIYLDHRPFPHGSLRHEIAHAVASAFGDPLFGVAARRVAGVPVLVSPGLIEGLAVALDWPAGYERLTPHESVRALQVMGLQPAIRQLLSLRFLSVSSARSYTTAGSFLRFLLDRHGAPPLRRLYASGGDFAGAYGAPLARLEAEWLAMIGTIAIPPEVVEGTRERFRQGSVFSRPCPHAVAARRERAVDALAGGERARAVRVMREVCRDAPDEPRYRLELGDFLFGGEPAERVEAIAAWTSLALDDGVTSSLRADALDRLARTAAQVGDVAQVRAIVARARALPVDPNARRQLEAQWFALEHRGPAGEALRGYFFAASGAVTAATFALLATLAEPELGLGHYLLGLQEHNAGRWQQASDALDAALARGLPSLPFVKNAARRLAVAAFRAVDRPRLRAAIAALRAPGTSSVDRLLADDWEQRVELTDTGRLSRRGPVEPAPGEARP